MSQTTMEEFADKARRAGREGLLAAALSYSNLALMEAALLARAESVGDVKSPAPYLAQESSVVDMIQEDMKWALICDVCGVIGLVKAVFENGEPRKPNMELFASMGWGYQPRKATRLPYTRKDLKVTCPDC